jgi:molecular chaperone DnaJ
MNSFNEDPYVILGLLPGASEKKIRKSYRRLAKKYHPDKNPDDPEAEKKFKQVQRAYERLSQDEHLKDVRTGAGQRGKPSADSADPFFSFFTAIKSHYSKWKEGK